jgi:hypothetical protein
VLADAICPTDAVNWGDARCDVHWESHACIGADYDGTLNKLGAVTPFDVPRDHENQLSFF